MIIRDWILLHQKESPTIETSPQNCNALSNNSRQVSIPAKRGMYHVPTGGLQRQLWNKWTKTLNILKSTKWIRLEDEVQGWRTQRQGCDIGGWLLRPCLAGHQRAMLSPAYAPPVCVIEAPRVPASTFPHRPSIYCTKCVSIQYNTVIVMFKVTIYAIYDALTPFLPSLSIKN